MDYTNFAFVTRGIMLVAGYWFRASIDELITVLATSPEVVVSVRAGGNFLRKLDLEISNAGL